MRKKNKLSAKSALLSIAGFDPTSGAGVSLDMRVFQHLGFAGFGAITALTAQNTEGVQKTHLLPPDFLLDQYRCLTDDIKLSGIKVGMIASKDNISPIINILSENPNIPKVVDPVFKSSSGVWLLDKDSIQQYIQFLSDKISLLTPNLQEAALIIGTPIENLDQMKEAAEKIFQLTKSPCFLKGGHLEEAPIDILYDGKTIHLFKKERLKKSVHGTGCFLSASILAYLARGSPLSKACDLAVRLTHFAIKNAVSVGKGQEIIVQSW